MRETGGLWGPVPDISRKEEEEALRLLEESQGFLRTILMGVALQYRSLDMERCRLLSGEENPSGPTPEAVQTAASLITLCALFGFQRQAEEIDRQTAASGTDPDMMDVKLGAVSILITLIRLVRLQASIGQKGAAGELETVEALSEMPDL